MKLLFFLKKRPVLLVVLLLAVMTTLTELLQEGLMACLGPLLGRHIGDSIAAISSHVLGILFCLVLPLKILNLKGKLGFRMPKRAGAWLLTMPLVVLCVVIYNEYFFGGIELIFKPTLFVIYVFLYMSIGLMEELFFRGVLQGLLIDKWGGNHRGMMKAVLLSNLIFCLAHLTNLLMGRLGPMAALNQVIISFNFGVFFSALFLRNASIYPGAIMHMLFDFLANLDAFAPDYLYIPRAERIRIVGWPDILIGIIISLPLLVSGLIFLRRSKMEGEGRQLTG